MSQVHVLSISSVDRSAKDAVVIHFRQPPFGRIHYLPGQYITLRISLEGDVHFRSYSLCSSPRLDDRLSIGLNRVPEGIVSHYLVDHARPGMELEVMEPRGRFFIDNSVKENRHIVLLSGGSGLSPLFAILRSTLYNEPNSRVSLLHSQRHQDEILFWQELQQLERTFPDRLRARFWISSEQGRLSQQDIRSFMQRDFGSHTHQECFICGPEGLMKEYRQAAEEAGIDQDHLHQESFLPNVDEEARRNLVNGQTRQVDLEIRGETYSFSVPPGATVLDAAMDRGILVPHSCKQGTCASCLSTLEAGSVVMAKEDALLDFERQKGKILACQAQPTSDDVFIRFT